MAGIAVILGGAPAFAETMVVDRGLPTINLNNAAGANRANVSWAFTEYTPSDYWLVGDTFQNTSAQTWDITKIQLWSTGDTATADLWGGVANSTGVPTSTIGIVSGAPSSMTSVHYADGSLYQGSGGGYSAINQIDFAVNIALAPGQTYDFFLDGTGNGELDQNGNPIVVPFSHASNAALSGSPQDGSDNLMLYAEVVGGVLDPASVGQWDSNGGGWDKSSDVNVQVFVPDGGTTLMLLGSSLAGLAWLRRKV